MPSNARTFYKVLEVDSEASSEVIEAAYRRLARRYHPDLNPNQDTTGKMQELNEAYAVLRDPKKRMSYDVHLRVQAEAQSRRTSAAGSANTDTQSANPRSGPYETRSNSSQSNPYRQPSVAMATACQKCGRSDASLRFAQFPFVISVVFMTFRRGDRGLFCSDCRREKMSNAKILTLLLGWWGIPWGPIYSLGTLFTSDEGVIDAKLNADYLRYLTGYFLRAGNKQEAHKAVQASLKLQYDPELAAVARSIFGNGFPSPQAKPNSGANSSSTQEKAKLKWVPTVIGVLFVVVTLLAIFLSARSSWHNSGAPITTSPLTSSAQAIPASVPDSRNEMIASIRSKASQSMPTALPTQDTNSSDAFLSLSFCKEDEFNTLAEKCTRNRDVFTGTVERLYVSWVPSQTYEGTTFLKKWYLNSKHIRDSEGTDEFGYLEEVIRPSLKAGNYRVDLYVGDTMVAQGNFKIQ